MLRITKRDGSHQALELAKIQRALLMAFNAAGEVVNVSPLVQRVAERLEDGCSVDDVSQACESVLVESGHVKIAAGFMRYRLEREAARSKRLVPDNSALSDYIHVGKYARYIETDARREVYSETVDRCFQMHYDRLDEWYANGRITEEDFGILVTKLENSFDLVYRKAVLPSMRSMQFGGKAIEKNNARMYNCSFTHVDRWRCFAEIFFLLLSGCGVGYSVQWQHVEKLGEIGRVGKQVVHYEIEDSIEGWADAVDTLIRSYQAGVYIEFSYSKIRPEGAVLRTSGGRAPGHLPLKRCLDQVRGILDRAQGRKLRPLEAHDIICFIAEAVLAGGIRRSSLISLFSPSDTEMLYCKAVGNFEPGGLNSQRQMANNSAALLRGSTSKDVFDRIIRVAKENYGDPGFYWTNDLDYGSNPCGEIGLWPVLQERNRAGSQTGFQFCNLCEVNIAVLKTPGEFIEACKAAAFIGTMQASYTSFPYLGRITEEITKREALIGVGIMGMADNPEMAFAPALLRSGALAVVAENQAAAELIGIKAAARATTVKPGGTAPLEAGVVSSGISYRWARRQIRRVTANKSEAPFNYFKSINPHMCEEKPNGDWVINFPIAAPAGAMTMKDGNAQDFMSRVFLVYENWIIPGTVKQTAPGLTHNVSATVVLKEDEDVSDDVWANQDRIAAMSFAPYLLDKKFRFAPNEAIVDQRDEAFYNHLIRLYKKVDWKSFKEGEDNTSLRLSVACAGGACELS